MADLRGDRAVVLGGSMAGLLAARVLVDFYAEVVVVERDPLPRAATHRRGVPQSRHIHGLLARGQEALEELFRPDRRARRSRERRPETCCRRSAPTSAGHLQRRGPSGLVALKPVGLCSRRPCATVCARCPRWTSSTPAMSQG